MVSLVREYFRAIEEPYKEGNMELIDHLSNVLGVNVKDGLGNTGLIYSCKFSNIDLCKFLIERGADVNISNVNGFSAIHFAITKDQIDIVKLLIEYGADVSQRNLFGDDAARYSIITRSDDILPLLIRAGADVNYTNEQGFNQLLFTAAKHYSPKALLRLLDAGAIDFQDGAYNFIKGVYKNSAYLLYKLSDGDSNKLSEVVEFVLKNNCLHEFCIDSTFCGNLEALQFIKNKFKVQINKITDRHKNTLLCIASKSGSRNLVKWIYDTVSNETAGSGPRAFKPVGAQRAQALNDKKELIKYFIRPNNQQQIAIQLAFDPQWGTNVDAFKYLYTILTTEHSQAFTDYIITKFLLSIVPHKELTTFYAHFISRNDISIV